MKLNTDNPETMPITDAVYGRRGPSKPASQPRGHSVPLWRAVPVSVLNQLARRGKETRRLAARRRQEGS